MIEKIVISDLVNDKLIAEFSDVNDEDSKFIVKDFVKTLCVCASIDFTANLFVTIIYPKRTTKISLWDFFSLISL